MPAAVKMSLGVLAARELICHLLLTGDATQERQGSARLYRQGT